VINRASLIWHDVISKNDGQSLGEFTMARSVPGTPLDSGQARAVAEEIGKDTDTAPEVVEEIYQQELSSLASEAKITQFLGVIATRRVRMMLKKH
jgi:hypothetical protein